MRAVGLSDLDMAARAVMCRPVPSQEAFASELIEAAHLSDKVRLRTGKPNRCGGTGSLFAQATLHPTASSSPHDAAYLIALQRVIAALEGWRGRINH